MIERILIVDDEPRVLQTLARNLEFEGYRVAVAADGETALQLYQQIHPDVTLVDVRMPGMDGFAVLAAIRALNADAEVIQITGHGDMETAIQALRAGASDFLPKPVEHPTLQAALHRAAERLNLKRTLEQTREDLRASEADYRAITETAFVGVGVVDLEENLTFVNAAFADMLGYTREELLRMNLRQLAPPEEYHAFRQRTLQRKENVRDQYETRLLTRDGRTLEVLVSVAPLRARGAQEITHILGVVVDITERKRAERERDWEARINAVMAELAQALLSSATLDEISDLVLERAKALTGSHYGFVGYIEPRTGHFVSATLTHDIWDKCQVPNKTFIFEHFRGLWGWMLEQRQPLLTNTPATDPRSAGLPEGHIPVKRFLAVPALHGDTLVGGIALINPPRDYEARDLEVVQRLASLYALAVINHQTQAALELYAHQQSVLYAITAAAAALLQTPEKLLTDILQVVQTVLRADVGWITVPSAETNGALQLIATVGLERFSEYRAILSSMEQCPSYQQLLKSLEPPTTAAVINNCPHLHKAMPELPHHICIPLFAGGQVLGVLTVGWRSKETVPAFDPSMLLAIGQQVGIAMQNARLYQDARQVDRLRVLNALDRALTATLDPEHVLQLTLEQLAAALGVSRGALALRKFQSCKVYQVLNGHAQLEGQHGFEPKGAYLVLERLEQHRQLEPLSGKELSALLAPESGPSTALWADEDLLAPIWNDEGLIGLLLLTARAPERAFTAEDRALVQAAANRAGQAYRNAELYANSEAQARRLAALNEISAVAVSSLEPEIVLQRILDLSCQTLEAQSGAILLRNAAGTHLIFTAATGANSDRLSAVQLAIGQGVVGWVATQGESVLINDATHDPRFYSGIDALTGITTHAIICAPLRHRDSVTGVIEALNKVGGDFTPEDLELLEAVAAIASVALENARLYTRTRARAEELALLNEIGLMLTSTLDVSQIIKAALQQIHRLFQAEGALLLQPEPQTGELVAVQALIRGEFRNLELRVPPGIGLSNVVLNTGQPIVLADAQQDSRFFRLPDNEIALTRALMAVPLWTRETVSGVLMVGSTESGVFSPEHLHTLQALASTLSVALENARLYEELKQLLREREAAHAQLIRNEKMAALGRLTASLAHEINNPLQAVQGCLTLATEELSPEGTPAAADHAVLMRYLTIAEEEIRRISNIVRHMRSFYRPSSDTTQPVDVHELLINVLALTNKQLQHHEIEVLREWDPNLPPIRGNADHLKQVFLNLILNAIDAMPRGGRLHVRTRQDQLPSGFNDTATEAAVRIEFADTGPGMPPEVLARLFEPFVTTKEHGTGLGLSISYGIIKAHRGNIFALSEPGVGTTLVILLPIA